MVIHKKKSEETAAKAPSSSGKKKKQVKLSEGTKRKFFFPLNRGTGKPCMVMAKDLKEAKTIIHNL